MCEECAFGGENWDESECSQCDDKHTCYCYEMYSNEYSRKVSNMKHIVCYSGGHSSALVAIEVVRKYGKENVILITHRVPESVEDPDIQRFRLQVADHLGIEITEANMIGWNETTPIDISLDNSAWKIGVKNAICTSRLKTEPFYKWLKDNYQIVQGELRDDVILYYGFDKNETVRVTRKIGIMMSMGYATEYPLHDTSWRRTIYDTEEIGISKPVTYEKFKHANCFPCLKAGMQHWFMCYCFKPDDFQYAKDAEEEIGYSIIKGHYLKDEECKFKAMKELLVDPTETLHHSTFWSRSKKLLVEEYGELENIPCDCSF